MREQRSNSSQFQATRNKNPHSPDQPICEQADVEITWRIQSDYIPPLIPIPHITSYPYNPFPSNGEELDEH